MSGNGEFRDDDEPYEAGYRKPPRKNQFQPGQSGNPKGRPKGAKSPKQMLRNLLEKKVQLKINGKIRSITALEAAFTAVLSNAIAGKPAAFRTLIQLIKETGYLDKGPPEGTYGVLRVHAPLPPDEWLRRSKLHHEKIFNLGKEAPPKPDEQK